jgi:hypothetical protein
MMQSAQRWPEECIQPAQRRVLPARPCSTINLCVPLCSISSVDRLALEACRETEAALLIPIAMFNLSRSTGLCVLLACSGFLLSSQTQAFDLTGAWATSADRCSKVFAKKGDQINFAQFSEEFGGGFVAA